MVYPIWYNKEKIKKGDKRMVKLYDPNHPSQYIEVPVSMEENRELVLNKYNEKARKIARELNPKLFEDEN